MNSATLNIVSATDADFEKEAIDASNDRVVVVDFWAAWCGPCKALAPILEQVSVARPHVVRIVKVDVDAEQRLAGRHGVRALPTLAFFRNGRMVKQLVGLQSAEAIVREIDALSADADL